jgi:predicted RNA binding protein with dsRBD fold (UPF0201 family)
MAELTMHVEAEVHPTETEEKVKSALANMFGNLSIHVEPLTVGCMLVGEAKSREALENFRSVLRRDRVRAAARKLLHSNVRGSQISFCLNKQVAFTGHVSFSQETGECPLGPIKVVIETENPRDLVDWLAPRITET